ncbi:unnamed protein product, partial [Sphenostylis stenocarpa]
ILWSVPSRPICTNGLVQMVDKAPRTVTTISLVPLHYQPYLSQCNGSEAFTIGNQK